MRQIFKKSYFASAVAATIVFGWSLWLVPYYRFGDQTFYINAYYGVKGLDISSAQIYYRSQINSFEPMHFLSIWVSSLFLEKVYYVSILNMSLAFLAHKYFTKIGAHWSIALLVVCTNFYFLTLYIPAERLKISVMFFFLALLLRNRVLTLFVMMLSALSHVSVLIVVFSKIAAIQVLSLRKLKINYSALVLGMFLLLAAIALGEYVISKVMSYRYSAVGGLGAYLKTALLFAGSLYYSRNKIEIIVIFSILLLSIGVVGDNRINMFSYFLFLHYALPVKKGVNLGVLLTSLYFLYSSYYFVLKTITTGTTQELFNLSF